ncbi:conserved hypothetical protein [Treponema primitia ZAS-2]|uniref:DUF5107 domain-containing protein n=1 Tax=Treponema primitia (strain ATCC BAA-887 / DSM 12427 / ZAS-2) TaxID=545694 RepID=F5YP51_TREPZ|nr:DUF5107 domain-containing protein [Treponema primitia]AEF84523.1 conserved hypothetical protein [Treponema primitia ZAS-2]
MPGKTSVRTDWLFLKGSPRGLLPGMLPPDPGLGALANPQPLFRDPAPDLPVAAAFGFPEDKHATFGSETAFRILPYTRQDRYNRELEDLELPSVVLENDFLKAEFIPALGGRLWSLYDKTAKRDILYRNPVFRPANLAIRDAWFSGGIEWNIGRLGHSVHTCAPVFAGVLETAATGGAPSSGPVLRIWEFERQTRLFWRIEFTLADEVPVLYAAVCVENPDPVTKPLYWWTNAAVPQKPGVRVLSATDEVIYFVPGTGKMKTMGGAKLPELPTMPGADTSYPARFTYSNEYFFQNDRTIQDNSNNADQAYPWEIAVYEDGYAYAEASTAPLLYRKMFCWGSGPGGRRWQDFLSLKGEEYLEVQAGLAPTQLHTAEIAGDSVVDWVQGFTALNLDPAEAHQKDYAAAGAYSGAQLADRISRADLGQALEAARRRWETPVSSCLALGSGWGALETELRHASGTVADSAPCMSQGLVFSGAVESAPGMSQGLGFSGAVDSVPGIPRGLSFPGASIGEDERPWLELITKGALPMRPVEEGPGGFVVDETWERLLMKSPGREGDWLTPYHLGVIALERGDAARARACWEESLKGAENPWAYRNLGVVFLRENKPAEALDQYRKIFSRFGGGDAVSLDRSFAEEYVTLLMEQGLDVEAAAVLDAWVSGGEPRFMAEDSGPLTDALAKLAFARRDDALLDTLFSREPAHIREANTTLIDLWISREARRLGERENLSTAEAEEQIKRRVALGELSPPMEIDFRMFT